MLRERIIGVIPLFITLISYENKTFNSRWRLLVIYLNFLRQLKYSLVNTRIFPKVNSHHALPVSHEKSHLKMAALVTIGKT